ncbi:hypothetical protein J6590_010575 [Homalodisca vitripennis]|nr:hypothetical protein J6590_010575 [Homalodisca vitripennis]
MRVSKELKGMAGWLIGTLPTMLARLDWEKLWPDRLAVDPLYPQHYVILFLNDWELAVRWLACSCDVSRGSALFQLPSFIPGPSTSAGADIPVNRQLQSAGRDGWRCIVSALTMVVAERRKQQKHSGTPVTHFDSVWRKCPKTRHPALFATTMLEWDDISSPRLLGTIITAIYKILHAATEEPYCEDDSYDSSCQGGKTFGTNDMLCPKLELEEGSRFCFLMNGCPNVQ